MIASRSHAMQRFAQRGAGMVETMIGILIGLLVVLVVYNLLSVAEGYRRTTTGAADAQITGLLSQFLTMQEAANGGNGLTSAYSDLIACEKTEGDVAYTADNTLKPIPVIITAGAGPTDSDSFVSRQSGSPHVVWPVDFRLPKPSWPARDIVVQSPNGFSSPDGRFAADCGQSLLGHRHRQRRYGTLRADPDRERFGARCGDGRSDAHPGRAQDHQLPTPVCR